ncbi:hypothetical protein CDAR_394251 [Caerostris darwini]|uniref:Uncharacterized protein n=1 Tax=Caerostris darwini TaxID=1538125 RepID=A0AAV4REF5_9ARAC|nr:hypothetical protein CDAR_394251 [Caerostris darwini]
MRTDCWFFEWEGNGIVCFRVTHRGVFEFGSGRIKELVSCEGLWEKGRISAKMWIMRFDSVWLQVEVLTLLPLSTHSPVKEECYHAPLNIYNNK